jgi:hypothetical protein
MHFRAQDQPPNAAGLLFQVAGELIDRGTGLQLGEVIGPRGRLFTHGDMTALLALGPTYLPDAFAVCRDSARNIVLVWLLPITTDEADFVFAHGWRAFENALVAADPDLTDIDRPSLVNR